MAGLTSAVPAAIAGLLAQCQTVANQHTELQVIDAEVVTPNNWPAHYVQATGVSNWTQAPRNLGNLRREEAFVIECQVRVWSGQQDPATLRELAFAYLEDVALAFTADPTLGGAVIVAQLITGAFTQGVPDGPAGGWEALIEFGVHCDVQLER